VTADSRRHDRLLWRLAWLAWLASIPLRLYYFGGYGLGDDPNFINTPLNFLHTGHFDLADHHTSRPGMLLPQILVFRLLGVSDFSFVLPILVCALGTHAWTLFLTRSLLGARAALLVSLFFLTTPFETLSATSFVPDYIVAFWSLAAACGCWRGWRTGSRVAMAGAGAAIACAVFTKSSAVLLFPALGLANLLTWRSWRGWLTLWLASGVALAAGCVFFWYLGGGPLHWLVRRADRPEGHDVTAILGYVLSLYPRYLFLREPDFGHWMFGIAGWAALLGVVTAVGRLRSEGRRAASVVVLFGFLELLLLNFVPHKLTFHAYYSHPRIFRYLAQVSPFVYLAAAFFLEQLLQARVRTLRAAAVVLGVAAFAFGLYEAPLVSEPTWDATADGRVLARYFTEHRLPPPQTLQSDFWHCYRIYFLSRDGPLERRCGTFETTEDKQRFLAGIREGYVVTGGGRVAWYSDRHWALDLTLANFAPPPTWRLLFQRDAPVKPWRREPLRVWRVEEPAPAPPASRRAAASRPAVPSIRD